MSAGGSRKGAGRKAALDHLKRNTVTIRLPQWLIDKLPKENRSALIERSLCKTLKLRAPKGD